MIASLPPSHHRCWLQLASGAIQQLSTTHLGTQLMCKRMERSAEPVATKAAELHAYFARWERVLPGEIAQISKL